MAIVVSPDGDWGKANSDLIGLRRLRGSLLYDEIRPFRSCLESILEKGQIDTLDFQSNVIGFHNARKVRGRGSSCRCVGDVLRGRIVGKRRIGGKILRGAINLGRLRIVVLMSVAGNAEGGDQGQQQSFHEPGLPKMGIEGPTEIYHTGSWST